MPSWYIVVFWTVSLCLSGLFLQIRGELLGRRQSTFAFVTWDVLGCVGPGPRCLLLWCVSLKGDTLLGGESVTRLPLSVFGCFGFSVFPMVTNPLPELPQ